MGAKVREMCIHRSEATWSKAYTITGIKAQRIERGRIYGGGGYISELHRKDTNRVMGKQTAGITFPV